MISAAPISLSLKSSSVRGVFRTAVVLSLLISIALIFLLVRAVDHRTLSDQNIGYLLILNGLVAGSLLVVIVAICLRLRSRLKEGRFGSKLLMKLAAIFALVGLLPGILIYSVSYQFVSRSIESWFDVRVENALEAGLNLGRASLDGISNNLSNKVRMAAKTIELENDVGLPSALDRLREQLGADDVQVWNQSGALLGSSGGSRFQLTMEKPTASQMRSLRSQNLVAVFEGLDDASKNSKLKILAILNSSAVGLKAEPRYLVVSEKLPSTLVANALAVQNAHSEYQERALSRTGLQKMYIGTLTLSLFLAGLGAFILAIVLGNQLVRPLLVLASGVEKVSQGDLSPKLELQDDNELAGLTRSFASMTQQLMQARVAEQKTERIKAWNEIAQRVAHEIKNPLTPIQLSAERLALKLNGKLEGADAALLEKSVKTIVDQVEAMKRLVNEFRDYARLPSAELKPIHLQVVIADTLQLYEHEIQTGQIEVLRGEGDDQIAGDIQQLRQVIHNLLQNALDSSRAQILNDVHFKPEIKISLMLNESNDSQVVCCIEDNGMGFASHILARAFEPYNTTKPKGTGLGLAVVRKIIQDHQGEITLSNITDRKIIGARVRLSFPLLKKGANV
jgi:nitrogen fixation/metabolism regulation signal transduction histidine kinase